MQPPFCEYLHMLERVDLIGDRPHSRAPYTLTPVWRGVDRPESASYGLPLLEMGERLQAIILQGRGYSSVAVRRDVYGKSYVSARARFYACDMANSLREIEEQDSAWQSTLGEIGRPPPMAEWLVRPVL